MELQVSVSTLPYSLQSQGHVTIADVQSGDKIVQDLTGDGLKAQYVHCDVTDWISQDAAFKAALAFSPTKTLDIVASFAGVDRQGHLVDHVKTADVSLTSPAPAPPSINELKVNTIGTLYTATLALHYSRLIPQGEASPPNSKVLIIVSSAAGYIDDTHNTAYTTSKFGSRGLFRALRTRAKDELNIRVNLVAPWAIKTPMTAPLIEQLANYGIEEGKGITFVKSEILTNAVAMISVDETFSGKFILQLSL